MHRFVWKVEEASIEGEAKTYDQALLEAETSWGEYCMNELGAEHNQCFKTDLLVSLRDADDKVVMPEIGVTLYYTHEGSDTEQHSTLYAGGAL